MPGVLVVTRALGWYAASASISDDGLYRYSLERRWDPTYSRTQPTMAFVMLNPSTADGGSDDPTIRRCISFAKREGCGALNVVNLFALRSTDPTALFDADDPIGPENVDHLKRVMGYADICVAAWGAFWWDHREQLARPYIEDFAHDVWCLGMTKAGQPRHPLYVRGDQPLVRWSA